MANAIGWVQFRLSGGFKAVGVMTGLYALLIGMFLLMQFQFEYNARAIAESWTSILLYIQMSGLILFGTFRVMGGIRNDAKLGMMESHRMMPISGVHAVTGYVSVAAIQLIPFSILNLGLGAGLAMRAGLSTTNLFFSHVLLWAMAVVLWLIMALGALVVKQATILLAGVVLVAFLSQGMIVMFFPSVQVLVTPLIGEGVLDLRRLNPINAGQMLALVLQALVGAQFFFAAARKYQFADRPAFDGLRGLLLLCTWVGLYLVAMVDPEDFRLPDFFRPGRDESMIPVHLVATLLAGLLIALVPIASAARRAQAGVWRGLSPAMLLILTVVVGMLPVLGFLIHPPQEIDGLIVNAPFLSPRVGLTVLVISAFVATLYCLLRFMPANKPILRLNLVVLWLGFSWIVPLLLELVFQAILTPSDYSARVEANRGPSALMAMSSIGALVELWCTPRSSPWPGIAVQWGVAAILGLLLFRKVRSIKAAEKPVPVTAAVVMSETTSVES